MTVTRTSLLTAAILAFVVVGTAASCSAPPSAPSPSPTPSVTRTATSTPTPTPTATAAAFVVDCSTIISSGRLAAMTSYGSLVPPADFFAKVASEGQPSPYSIFAANGGVVCAYSGGSEVVAVYGYTPLVPGQSAEIGSLITSTDPYGSSSYAGGTLYSTQMDGNPFALFLVLESATYLASSQELLDDLLATVPLR